MKLPVEHMDETTLFELSVMIQLVLATEQADNMQPAFKENLKEEEKLNKEIQNRLYKLL